MPSKASKKAAPDPLESEPAEVEAEETEESLEPAEEAEDRVEESKNDQSAQEEKVSEDSPDLDPTGIGPAEETAPTDEEPEPTDAPLKDFIILNGPASYGPVVIGGQSVRCKKDVLYQVTDLGERAVVLGTGRFRSATNKDQARAGRPSAGPGGAITRDLFPPGALKGGLNTP